MESARIVQATEFRTCLIENNGNGTFTVKPLPAEAQLFPVHSILISDFNHDGIKDMLLGGNMYRAHIEYGRYDAGYGLYLLGLGNNQFNPRTIRQSGALIRGEVRDMAVVETPKSSLVFIAKNDARWQVLAVGQGE